MGTDSHATWMLAVDAACVAVFGGAVALRLLTTRLRRPSTSRPAPASRAMSVAGRTRPRSETLPRLLPPAAATPSLDAHIASATAPCPRCAASRDASSPRSRRAGCADAAAPASRRTSSSVRSPPGARPIVVANGVEGEPASHKDALLMRVNPHLVLDGAVAAAAAVGARRIIVAVGRGAAARTRPRRRDRRARTGGRARADRARRRSRPLRRRRGERARAAG